MHNFHWATSDHCGGILYGPYSRKEAFAIQKKMSGKGVCDRQDVWLACFIGRSELPTRLIRFKCKGVRSERFRKS